MVMHYNQTGRRLHNQSQTTINAMAQLVFRAECEAHQCLQNAVQSAPGFSDMGSATTEPVGRQEIIMTPEGRPMAMANLRGRLLHRADSGGANDWEIIQVPGGRSFIRSPTTGQQDWLDIVVNSHDNVAWPLPSPEGPEQKRARLSMDTGAATASPQAHIDKATADEMPKSSAEALVSTVNEDMQVRFEKMEKELAIMQEASRVMKEAEAIRAREEKQKAWDEKMKRALQDEAAHKANHPMALEAAEAQETIERQRFIDFSAAKAHEAKLQPLPG